ncbi:hypothetical protein DL95DRAFT_398793, partial [Leptodontidium sp. 2 PMI_412]
MVSRASAPILYVAASGCHVLVHPYRHHDRHRPRFVISRNIMSFRRTDMPCPSLLIVSRTVSAIRSFWLVLTLHLVHRALQDGDKTAVLITLCRI